MTDRKQSALSRRLSANNQVEFRSSTQNVDTTLQTQISELYTIQLSLEGSIKENRNEFRELAIRIDETPYKMDSIMFSTGSLITPSEPGILVWDTSYNSLLLGLTSNVAAPLGQSVYKRIRNNTGSTITKGSVVYVTGAHGESLITVSLADASSELTAATTIGVAAEGISNNSSGFIITQGYLRGINTNALGGVAGDLLWLSETAGEMTTTRPTQPAHGVHLGWLVKKAGSGAGSIYVRITNGQELYEIHDVLITSPANNDVLTWESATSLWKNKPAAAGSGTVTSITAGTGLSASPSSPITTSGTLSVSFGSTGTTACVGNDSRLSDARTPTAHTHTLSDLTQSSAGLNQVPQWNGSNWVPATISGGGGSPGGSTGQVQYNNASAFAGAVNVKINSDNLELVKPASEPTTAPVDSIVMFTKSIGQRDLPAFVDSSGWSTNLQTCIARNKFNLMAFNGGTNAAPTNIGMVYTTTTVGTGNTTGGTVALGTTSLLAGSRRQSFLTANTAGNAAGWRTSAAQCWRGNATKRGGFFCVWKFGIGDATFQANATLFVGLNDSTAVPDSTAITNPFTTVNATMRNTVGLALYGGSSTYQVIHRNGIAAATAISTGFTANINDIVEFCLYAVPNDTTIHYYVKIYSSAGSDTEISGDIGTSNIPVNTTLFVPHCWRGRTSTATTAVQVDCLTFSVEQPH
jgi:hypothetical protein